MKKGTEEENSVHQAREEGFEDFEDLESEGSTRANKIMEAVKRKNSYKDDLNEDLEKAIWFINKLKLQEGSDETDTTE